MTITLSPNRPSAASALTVTATGPFPQQSGQLRSAAITTQAGFSSNARSVAVLCTATQAANGTCPPGSRVGGGAAAVTGTYGTFSRQDTITFSLFLGVPGRRGDIASVVIEGSDSVFHQSAHVTGRLFKAPGGGLELLFDQLPQYSLPTGTQVTLDRLNLQAHAVRTVAGKRKHRHQTRYALITNPPTCSGAWSATLALSFSSGPPYMRSLTAPCSAH